MPNLLEEAFNAAGADMASYVTIKKVDPMYRAVYADGSELRVLQVQNSEEVSDGRG